MADWTEYRFGPGGSVTVKRPLRGTSHGNDLRHLIVREALLCCLIDHPQVQAQFSAWEQRLGGRDLILQIAAHRQELAALAGFETPYELEAVKEPLVLAPDRKRRFLLVQEQFAAAWAERQQRLDQRFNMRPDAEQLATALHCPWSWMADELIIRFDLMQDRLYEGQPFTTEWECIPSDPPAPLVTLQFTTNPPETVTQALARLEAEVGRVRAAIAAAAPALGKIPRKTRAGLERDARWFYRVRVKGESIRAVAGDAFGNMNADARWNDVNGGVKRAEGCLTYKP